MGGAFFQCVPVGPTRRRSKRSGGAFSLGTSAEAWCLCDMPAGIQSGLDFTAPTSRNGAVFCVGTFEARRTQLHACSTTSPSLRGVTGKQPGQVAYRPGWSRFCLPYSDFAAMPGTEMVMVQSEDPRELERKIEQAVRIASNVTDQTTVQRLKAFVEDLSRSCGKLWREDASSMKPEPGPANFGNRTDVPQAATWSFGFRPSRRSVSAIGSNRLPQYWPLGRVPECLDLSIQLP